MDNELNQFHEPLRKRSSYVCGLGVRDPTVKQITMLEDTFLWMPFFCTSMY